MLAALILCALGIVLLGIHVQLWQSIATDPATWRDYYKDIVCCAGADILFALALWATFT